VAYFSEGASLPRWQWDEETGNYYYGARYYDPKVSVWLRVDPLAHKYPSLSPYVFVANNPVMLVDPNGMEITFGWFDFKAKRTYKRIYEAADAATQAKYDALKASVLEYRVKSDGSLKSRTGKNAETSYNWDKDRLELTFDKGLNNPVGALGDELEHASQFENRDLGFAENGTLGYDMMDEIASQRAGIAATDNVNRAENSNLSNDQSTEDFKKFDAEGRPQDWFKPGQSGNSYMKSFGRYGGGNQYGNSVPANLNKSYSEIAEALVNSKFIYREMSNGKMVTRKR
jgi:RHS repeat-associated protein